jgi:lipopolysaccharide export system protein LptA
MQTCRYGLLWILLLTLCGQAFGQDTTFSPPGRQPDSGRIIHLLNADVLLGIQPKGKDSSQLQKLIGNVRLTQGGTIFTCDSALQNLTLNTIDAYGHIHINQADTINTYADFLHYVGNTKVATLTRNVRMTDGNMVLTTNVLVYDMNTHIGSYMNGGKLVNQGTVLTSSRGYYYADTKNAYFKNNVHLQDPEYTLSTDTLLYNTDSRIATFEAPTTIHTGGTVIHTSCGYYSTVENYAHLCNRSLVVDSSQQLTADSMNYNRNSGIGTALGHVVWTDTARKMQVLAGYAVSSQVDNTILATQKPVLVMSRKTDTLFLASDTLYSGPLKKDTAAPVPPRPAGHTLSSPRGPVKPAMPATGDSIAPGDTSKTGPVTDTSGLSAQTTKQLPAHAPVAGARDSVHRRNRPPAPDTAKPAPGDTLLPRQRPALPHGQPAALPDTIPHKIPDTIPDTGLHPKMPPPLKTADTSANTADSSSPRYIKAFHHVRLYSDSLQGVSDSLYYSDRDSSFHFYHDPILWTGKTQLTGDTIVLVTKNQQADRILLQHDAMIINEVSPGVFNQIKGTFITGYFKDGNVLSWMQVDGNAESMYYAQDDQGALVGGNRTTSARINLYFKDGKLNKVVFLKDVDGKFLPPTKIPEEDKKLRGFRWDVARRPQSKADLLPAAMQP